MVRKTAKDRARAQQMVANREKRWGKDTTDTNTSVPPVLPDSTAPVDTVSLFQHLSLEQNTADQPVCQHNESLIEPTEPIEPNDSEVDPENLPLEDPMSDIGSSDDGIDDNDGWWEVDKGGDNNTEDIEDKDYALRVDNQPIPLDDQNEMISKLDKIIRDSFEGKGKQRRSTFDELTLSRIRLMTMSLRLTRKIGTGLIDGSNMAAAAMGRGKWAAVTVRRWIREFHKTEKLPNNIFGTWNESIIEDEDLKAAIQEHLRCIGRYCSPKDIISFFDMPEAAPFTQLLDKPPTLRTAQRWMLTLGYKWRTERRGQFADGHEREDVVEFRQNEFIPKWIELERRMVSWDKDGKEISPQLRADEKEVMPHWHDESIFRAHDRRFTRWMQDGETAGLYKKGEGVSLMVADFVCEHSGFLRRPDAESDKDENNSARVVFRPGKERDGYFCNEDVRNQLERAISIATEVYPNHQHVFIFDNATTHTKLPEDAPIVSRMTLGPSHKVKGEKTGPSGEKIKVNFRPGWLSDGCPQELYYPLDHPKLELQGAFKGLAKILEERGIPGARKLKLQCPTGKGQTGCPPNQITCCARKIMANQTDFLSQKTILQLLAESHGCSVLYLPKYHCELNPIEQCWGAAKRVYRDNPMSSTEADLVRNTLDSLDSVKLESIRRFAARSRRFIHAYKDGLNGEQAAWANKRYHGHRVTTETAYSLFDGSREHV